MYSGDGVGHERAKSGINVWLAIFYSLIIISSVGICEALDTCPDLTVKDVRTRAQDHHEISLVLYHVVWSNESREALKHFEEIANDYTPDIYFATVNCWHLHCNCSRVNELGNGRATLPHRWPYLIIYYRQRYLHYTGDWSYMDLARLIERLYQPVQRVTNREELEYLNFRGDAVVLALLPNVHQSRLFNTYSNAALHWLELDAAGSFTFAVAVGKTAKKLLSRANTPAIYLLYEHNKTVLTFPAQSKYWRVHDIIVWLHSNYKQYNNKLAYMSGKSIAAKLPKYPVLTIVIDSEHHRPQELLQRNATNVKKTYIWRPPINYGHCLALPKKRPHKCVKLPAWHIFYDNIAELYAYVSGQNMNSLAWQSKELLQQKENRQKRLFAHTNNSTLSVEMVIVLSKYIEQYIKLVFISSNHTLDVVILDGKLHKQLLQQHNIALKPDNIAAVFIADAIQEKIYVMQENYSFQALLQFLRDYEEGNLIPQERLSTHNMPTINNNTHISVRDVNTLQLRELLQSKDITLVLLLYTPLCAFSAMLMQTLLQLAAMLRATTKIDFVRLNTQANDLPWELNMPRTPSLLIFAAGKGNDSRLFPSQEAVSVANVLSFILAQLEPLTQLQVALTACDNIKQTVQLNSCLQFVQTLVDKHISSHLKYWQLYDTQRAEILQRLAAFRDISLYIQENLQF